jgi:hypothetical protein
MEFTLTYTGTLPPRQRRVSREKTALRAAFGPQLAELVPEFYPDGLPNEHKVKVNDLVYLALVPKILHVGVHLDIQIFTPSQRRRPGDVDNRVKTLIDGLTVPLPGARTETEDKDPNPLCLLEDDSQVLRYTLDSRRWLAMDDPAQTLVLVGVRIVNSGASTYGGMRIAL